jgi:hypothetical protein
MKELERKFRITYRWWRGGNKTIKQEHIEDLDEHAMEHIQSMMLDGYSSGELNANVNTAANSDLEDGIEYSGYWEVKKGDPE